MKHVACNWNAHSALHIAEVVTASLMWVLFSMLPPVINDGVHFSPLVFVCRSDLSCGSKDNILRVFKLEDLGSCI